MKALFKTIRILVLSAGLLFTLCVMIFSYGTNNWYFLFTWKAVERIKWKPQNVIPWGRDDFPVKIPDVARIPELSNPEAEELYYSYIQSLQVLCQRVIRIGSFLDGGKEMCIDEPYKPKRPCLVYSFGINWLWDFDEDIVSMFGCEVFAFDPGMSNETDYFIKGPNITFYKIGIWDRHMVNEQGWHLMTLKQIRKKLGHENRIIDVLKIDIEWAEWTVLPEIIASGELQTVKQMLIEFHTDDTMKTLLVFRMVYEARFRIFMRERNPLGCRYKVPWSIRERPHCIEMSFIHI
ncbi:hypothetical protein ACJMK2_012738 [Sinanodonta woodiana]|uniref:Methyltransferase domain-containing protein n=1 Tax=Sinanodonta woodiana TaxID=1069815 RepID=A0ABD3VC71_SINWO